MQLRTVTAVSVVDIKKIRNPFKHYVFIISVSYSDSSSQLLYRRYSHFFNLQMKLLDLFPEEGGQRDPKFRIIPFLPGKVLFGRSQIRDVAVRRLKHLDNYCQALLRLPPHISQSEEVLKFFEPKLEDLLEPQTQSSTKHTPGAESREAMSGEEFVCVFVVAADYQRQENTEISLRAGERVEVIEKNDTGWWFVSTAEEQGWFPSTYLVSPAEQRDDHRTPKGDSHYVTVQAYSSSSQDELGFECGVRVEVIQKNLEGWWFIRYEGKEGWAPASYLKKVQDDGTPANHTVSTESSQESTIGQVEIIGNLMEISNLLNRKPANSDTHTHSNASDTYTYSECDTDSDSHFSIKSDTASSTHTTADTTHADDITAGVEITGTHTCTGSSSDTHPHSTSAEMTVTESSRACVEAPDVSVCVSLSESTVCSTVQRTHTPAVARVTPQRYHSVENGSPSYIEKPPPRRENSLGFQLPQPPDPPSVDAEYYTIAEFHSCLGDGISFSGGERAEVIKKNSGGWWYVQIGNKEGWAPCSYIDKRKKPSLNRKTSTLTRPKVPPPAPPIKKQTSLPCMESEVTTLDKSCVYEEPEYDVPAVSLEPQLEFLPSDTKAQRCAPYWLGEDMQEQTGEEQCVYYGVTPGVTESLEMRHSHSHTSSRGRQRPIWDPPEYDAPTIEFNALSISQEPGEGSKPKPSVRPKPSNPDFCSLKQSLKHTNQQNHNQWRTSQTSAGSETDSASSLDDSLAFKLSVSAEAEVMPPWLSISTEGEVMPPRVSVSAKSEVTPPRSSISNQAEVAPLQLYRSTAEFQQGAPGELSLPAGVLVEVLEKQQSGWWFVRWGAQEGWVPTYFLRPITHTYMSETSNSEKNEEGGQKVTGSNNRGVNGVSGANRVTVRPQDENSNAGVNKDCAAIIKDNASVSNDYASVTKDKNGVANENTGTRWKNETRRDLTSSGRSIPVSMVKPKPQIIHNNLREEYVSVADYHGDAESMGFPAGTRLEVLEKNTNGWWYCRTTDFTNTRRGWVPSNFLEKRK
ncbi:SH3 and PX domain-containing protein 2A isoform X1 [Pygocentrus nattereri]|uniref:SH3 and PX domain-containing protein 2A isoform X1 n=2 Tax=Pygocentrus nattereri TaxID=42514 RepID=UPI000814A50D|nr:SH3 and PX domain-containing protein 2A isoform X1 [Pygocentrus nattereri]